MMPPETRRPKYDIGTTYMTRGKVKQLRTVADILYTFNSANQLVKFRYVTTHEFLGGLMYDYDVVETGISMGLVFAVLMEYPEFKA